MPAPLFLFYEEPDPDRWFPGDHVPRRWIRRIVRGKPRPGGVMRWFLNLKAGLDEIGTPYRVNDYRGLRRHPGAPALVIGKPHVVTKIPAGHPIVFGPGIDDHPSKSPFWSTTDVRLLVIPCPWFDRMYVRDLPKPIPTVVWPAGIDTQLWQPPSPPPPGSAVLIYDKIRWQREHYEPTLIAPIHAALERAGCEVHTLRYGYYREEDYQHLLTRVHAMVFLCEHETQGFAYQQALASGVPIIAWDRGGFWQDPQLYPDQVKFGPVSSVPYWDQRCGERFADVTEFAARWPTFWTRVQSHGYPCREFVLENLTLAGQARRYVELVSTLR